MDMDGMDMGGGSSGGVSMMSMMTPWLHFNASDDTLLFKSLRPRSPGAIAGACIALIAVSLLERWLSGVRAKLEAYWRTRSLSAKKHDSPASSSDGTDEKVTGEDFSRTSARKASRRTVAPFIARYDVPRGTLFSLQALLGYILMLSVMTFQAAFIISIVVGLGLGEMLFGRMGNARGHGVLH
ncbi:hypothetical protein PM082_003034 [Marasmius tenuissimus]|nr:hypothetical protein PM082_003034 [Marasmius tenuissimus]